MINNTVIATEEILAALVEQLAGYRKLRKLCDLQRQYVQQNRTDDLLETLEARSKLLADIGRLEAIVIAFKRGWAEIAPTLDERDRTTAADLLVEGKALLGQITQSDQDDVLLLQQRKLNVGREIQTTTSARKINGRYAASAYGGGSSQLNVRQ